MGYGTFGEVVAPGHRRSCSQQIAVLDGAGGWIVGHVYGARITSRRTNLRGRRSPAFSAGEWKTARQIKIKCCKVEVYMGSLLSPADQMFVGRRC